MSLGGFGEARGDRLPGRAWQAPLTSSLVSPHQKKANDGWNRVMSKRLTKDMLTAEERRAFDEIRGKYDQYSKKLAAVKHDNEAPGHIALDVATLGVTRLKRGVEGLVAGTNTMTYLFKKERMLKKLAKKHGCDVIDGPSFGDPTSTRLG
jgi:hypothetical protein